METHRGENRNSVGDVVIGQWRNMDFLGLRTRKHVFSWCFGWL